jgi:hypothetical protein
MQEKAAAGNPRLLGEVLEGKTLPLFFPGLVIITQVLPVTGVLIDVRFGRFHGKFPGDPSLGPEAVRAYGHEFIHIS